MEAKKTMKNDSNSNQPFEDDTIKNVFTDLSTKINVITENKYFDVKWNKQDLDGLDLRKHRSKISKLEWFESKFIVKFSQYSIFGVNIKDSNTNFFVQLMSF